MKKNNIENIDSLNKKKLALENEYNKALEFEKNDFKKTLEENNFSKLKYKEYKKPFKKFNVLFFTSTLVWAFIAGITMAIAMISIISTAFSPESTGWIYHYWVFITFLFLALFSMFSLIMNALALIHKSKKTFTIVGLINLFLMLTGALILAWNKNINFKK